MSGSLEVEGRDEAGRDDSVLIEWAAEVADRIRASEAVDLEELSRRHPERAGALRRLLPAMALMADLATSSRRVAAEFRPVDPDPGSAVELGVLGDFRLLREVGRGGMGIVYEAEQISLDRRVALKVLPFAAAIDPRQLQRFQVEAKAAAFLHHTHIVPVHAVGCDRGVHYYAMQFIDGRTLTDVIGELRRIDGLDPHGPGAPGIGALDPENGLPVGPARLRTEAGSDAPTVVLDPGGDGSGVTPAVRPVPAAAGAIGSPTGSSVRNRAYFRTVARLGMQAAEALEHAHQQGVLHRDIKPANLMLDDRGHLWVTDFGLARVQGESNLTMTGDLLGTLRYMSPEQALARRVVIDQRTDVYSLGATLYELLTLRPAFDGHDRAEILRRIAQEEPRPLRRLNLAVPTDLETVVRKAMDKDPAGRYATAGELAEDLERFLDARPVAARRPSLLDHAAKWSRRHKSIVASAALTAAILLIGTAVASVLVASKEHERRTASDSARALEARLRAQAEEGRKRQVRLNVEQGNRLMTDGDLSGSLPYFVEALRLDAEDPARAADHRLRLGMILAQCARPSRLWFHDQPLTAFRLRPDGRAFAVSHPDGTVLVRDADTGEPIGSALRHAGVVQSFDFSPDGRRLATACWDGTARIWDVATGREAIPPLEHRLPVTLVAFSPDGRLVVTGLRRRNPGDATCRVWDAATGRPVTDRLPSDKAYLARFSPDSRLIALANERILRLYDARTGQPASPPMPHGHQVELSSSGSFSPDGRRIVTGCLDSQVRVWDTATGRQVVPAMRYTHYAGASFSPDGRWVLSRSSDGTARVWDATTGAPRCDPMRHPGGVDEAVFSPDGTRVATRCADHAVRVWDAATGRRLLPPL
jgi:serine/threonine protein kinase